MYCLNAVVVVVVVFSIKIHACIIYIKYKYKNVGPLVCDAGIKIPI